MASTQRITGTINQNSPVSVPTPTTASSNPHFQNAKIALDAVSAFSGITLPKHVPMQPREQSTVPVQKTTEHKVGSGEEDGCCSHSGCTYTVNGDDRR